MKFLFLSTVINGGASEAVQAASAQPTGFSLFNGVGMIGYILFLIVLFYFLAIRPQKKREKQLSELQASINAGDWVVLDSGLYGKVTDISTEIFMVEFGTNKSVIIPVIKQRVIAKADPKLLNIL